MSSSSKILFESKSIRERETSDEEEDNPNINVILQSFSDWLSFIEKRDVEVSEEYSIFSVTPSLDSPINERFTDVGKEKVVDSEYCPLFKKII
jgi:hypothetical protein